LRLFAPEFAHGGGVATLLMALDEALTPATADSVNAPACSDVSCSVPG
jgi:hypothetical protein